jgi:hypothetical protein
MQLTKQTPGEDTWLVLTAQLERTARFLELPSPANDAAWRTRPFAAQPRVASAADALQAARQPDSLLRAIKRAARWLAAETLFGFAVCGSAAHPCLLDPAWNPYEHDPAGRGSTGNIDTAF